MLPATPPPDEMLDPLGPVLIVRTYSGPFIDHGERILEGWPDVVVFDDGLVVANTSPDSSFAEDPSFVSSQLDDTELEELTATVRDADLEPLAAGGQQGATFCFDCNTAIIRTDIGGATIEIAAAGLVTDVDPDYVASLPYPRSVITIDQLLDLLAGRIRETGAPFEGPLPMVPIAPCDCG